MYCYLRCLGSSLRLAAIIIVRGRWLLVGRRWFKMGSFGITDGCQGWYSGCLDYYFFLPLKAIRGPGKIAVMFDADLLFHRPIDPRSI